MNKYSTMMCAWQKKKKICRLVSLHKEGDENQKSNIVTHKQKLSAQGGQGGAGRRKERG